MPKRYKKCFFWGVAGQAKVLNEFISDFGYRLTWLFDNNPKIPNKVEGVPVLGSWKDFFAWTKKTKKPENIGFLVAIGGIEMGKVRVELQEKISKEGFKPLTVWHSSSYIAKNAKIGAGSQILAHATICAGTRLGKACIVNTGAQIDHDCVIEDGVHIMPGAILAGEVAVERFASIGSGAVILPKVTVGEGAIVGAGTVVTKNVKPYTVVVGVPARVLRKA